MRYIIATLLMAIPLLGYSQQPTEGSYAYRLTDPVIGYDFTGGLNTSKLAHLIANNESPFMDNAVLNDSMMITKRPGFRYRNTNSISLDNGVWGLYRYYKRNGTKKLLSACGGSLWVENNQRNPVELKADVTTDGDNQWRWVTYADRAFGCNGEDNVQVYDGYSDTAYIYDCGIPAPTIDPTEISQAAGNVTAGTYLYKYTYYDSATGIESNPSDSLEVTVVGTKEITIGVTNSTTTDRSVTLDKKVYRTEASGGTYYYLGTTSTTQYVDDTPDAELSATEIPTVNDQPPTFSDICVHKGQLIGTGDPDYPERVYFSSTISNQGPECWDPSAYVEIDTNDGSVPTRVIPMGEDLYVYTETRIYRLVGGAWTADILPSVRSIRSSTGTLAPWSLVNANGVLIYLTRIGENLAVYMYDGSLLHRLSDNIENELSNIVPGSIKYATASYVDKRYRIAFQDSSISHASNNKVLEYYVPTKSWWPLTGLYINCWSYWDGAGDQGELFFGDSRDGFICEYGQAARDPEMSLISFKFRTKSYDLGVPQIHKHLRFIYLDFVKGISNRITYKIIIDYGSDNVVGVLDLTDMIASKWGEVKWGEFKWGGGADLDHKIIALPKRAVSRYFALQLEDPA